MARLSYPRTEDPDLYTSYARPSNAQDEMADTKTNKKSRNSKSQKGEDSTNLAMANGTNSSAKRKCESEPKHKNKKSKQHNEELNGAAPISPKGTEGAPVTTNNEQVPESEIDSESNTSAPKRTKKTRGSRIGAKHGKKVGFYEESEIKKVEKYKVDFCNLHGLDAVEFDAMVQHSVHDDGDFPCSSNLCTKSEFWASIYELLPDRDRRSVYRFMRRHFQHSGQKPHEWSPEQDEELIELHAQYGPKYAFIGKLLGRSSDDVTQRWKNRLEHRTTMRSGPWEEEELRDLMRQVLRVGENSKQLGGSGDVYDMDDKIFPWSQISDGMNNTRSRQQCADKWRKIRKAALGARAASDPDAVFDPIAAGRKTPRGSERPTPSKSKSKQFVEESDTESVTNQQARAATKDRSTEPDPAGAGPDPESESNEYQDPQTSRDLGDSQMETLADQVSSDEDENESLSSPVSARLPSADEKKLKKKQQKRNEERELAEGKGPTHAQLLGQTKEERKKARRDLKEEKRRRKSGASTPHDKKQKKHRKSETKANGIGSRADLDNGSDNSDHEDSRPVKMEE